MFAQKRSGRGRRVSGLYFSQRNCVRPPNAYFTSTIFKTNLSPARFDSCPRCLLSTTRLGRFETRRQLGRPWCGYGRFSRRACGRPPLPTMPSGTRRLALLFTRRKRIFFSPFSPRPLVENTNGYKEISFRPARTSANFLRTPMLSPDPYANTSESRCRFYCAIYVRTEV